jgi:hypothetical protein
MEGACADRVDERGASSGETVHLMSPVRVRGDRVDPAREQKIREYYKNKAIIFLCGFLPRICMKPHDYRTAAVCLHLMLITLGIAMVALEFLPVEEPVHELLFLL